MLVSKRAVALMCVAMVIGASGAALAVERVLVGISLSSPAAAVLRKFGNPTRWTVNIIQVGAVGGEGAGMGAPGGTMPGGPVGLGGAAANPMAALGGSYPGGISLPGGGSIYGQVGGQPVGVPGGGLPGLPGLGMPGSLPSPGLPPPGGAFGPGAGGVQAEQAGVTEQEVTYTYDLTDGTTLEFLISDDGRVIQITVGGEHPYPGARTSRGVSLGMTYKDVVFRYGYPESHHQVGRYIRASYADKHRCVFTFLNKKLVGITIAFKPD